MDCLSSLPIAVLSVIHCLVYEAGGLRDALSLEAASRHLCTLLRCSSRFPDTVVTVDGKDIVYGTEAAVSFRRFIAAHGHRLDRLVLNDIMLGRHCSTLPTPHSAARGMNDVRTLSISCTKVDSLQPLAGLPNLEHLRCEDGVQGCSSLEPLESLTSLPSLTIQDNAVSGTSATSLAPSATSLAPLAGLTRLTSLQLISLGALTGLEPLASLGPTLSSLHLSELGQVRNLGPLTAPTKLTALELADLFNLAGGLAPLRALQSLRQLKLELISLEDDMGMHPLGSLAHLQLLRLRLCDLDLLPIAALAPSLLELDMYFNTGVRRTRKQPSGSLQRSGP
jgi:hypothetical protein